MGYTYEAGILTDETLGEFEYDADGEYFIGNVSFFGEDVEVLLGTDCDELEVIEAYLKSLHTLVDKAQALEHQWKQAIAAQMLPLANKEWRVHNRPIITEEEFVKELCVGSVSIDKDGSVSMYYGAENAFGDHSIILSANVLSGKIESIGL